VTPAEHAAVDDRIGALQWRTVGVGWAAVCLLGAGAIAAALAAGEIGRLLAGAAHDRPVPFHVPAAMRHAEGLPLLSLLVVGLALASAWGLSTGRLRRAHAGLAGVLCLAAAAADLFGSAPLHQPLFALPSPLERMVSGGRHAEADRQVVAASHPAMRAREDYVRAQIALRAGDAPQLESLGRPLLAMADDYVYAGLRDPSAAHVYHQSIGDLRIEVLAAIDRGLNGAPRSAAGIAVERERTAAGPPGQRAMATGATALGLTAAGLLMAALWRRMRGHVLRIIDLAG